MVTATERVEYQPHRPRSALELALAYKKPARLLRNVFRRSSFFNHRKCKSEDRYANYKGVRQVTIRKGTASLGIMIIEGRHAEVGQGIFISDIQENSAAEQAGLQIGDLILAVNKDTLLGTSYDAAATLLKRTEGVVVLTVCNPNKKDDAADEAGGDASLKPDDKSRPTTPKPSPAKPEPPPDPATAAIAPNKDTVIEINSQNVSPGILVVGGNDTEVKGAVILDIYPGGAYAKDGRLQPGDQILDSNGTAITKEMSHERICMILKQKAAKVKMTVHRPDPIQFQDVDVELSRKPGKGLGLSIMNRTPPPGSYIADILSGGPADVDGRLQKYDLIASVDGKELTAASHEEVALALKSVTSKVALKVKRFKVAK